MYEGSPLSDYSSIIRALTIRTLRVQKTFIAAIPSLGIGGGGGNTKKEKEERNQDANVIWHPPSPRILNFWGTGQGEYATTSPMASHGTRVACDSNSRCWANFRPLSSSRGWQAALKCSYRSDFEAHFPPAAGCS